MAKLGHQEAVLILQHAINHVLNVPDAVFIMGNSICSVVADGCENGIIVDPLYEANDLAAMACAGGSNMAEELTDEQRDEAQSLYRQMAAVQSKLWALSQELEELIGCAVDTTEDLQDRNLDYFIDKDEPV
jgi:hypothetical protein